uniref:uncharacterized protein LOC122587633 n=1 Tax=Erigeron canadensis TaxID=72917 RepID=UPI001CB897BA|nr:uncharacterized protein LOC122587633 [Erigeron canadensis]
MPAVFMWNWRRDVRSGMEQSQPPQICDSIMNVTIVNTPDKWIWDCNQDKDFTVKGVRNHIDNTWLPRHYRATRWNKIVLRKVNIFIWRVLKDRIPTRFNLWFRGIHNNSRVCSCCNNGIETLHHLFAHCPMAMKVWSKIARWLGLNIPHNLDMIELLDHVDSETFPKN